MSKKFRRTITQHAIYSFTRCDSLPYIRVRIFTKVFQFLVREITKITLRKNKSYQVLRNTLASPGRQRKLTPNLSPQDEKLEDQDAACLDEIKDEKRKADSELDALCTQINYLLYEADFDKVSIRQAQDRLVEAKEKIFGIITELQGVYRTRGEHKKADDVEVDMDLYQSRVGTVVQELGDKLKESAKRTVKPELDKHSSETENLQKWFREQSCRAFEAERFPERTIDDTPAQTPANLDL